MTNSDIDEFVKVSSSKAPPRTRPLNSTAEAALPSEPKNIGDQSAARCWAINGDAYFGVTKTTTGLPPGVYRCRINDQGVYLLQIPINTDDLIKLPDNSTNTILEEFDNFWKLKQQFTDFGFTHKRGILLWGPPGSGKTTAIWLMTAKIVNEIGGIVVFIENPELANQSLQLIRKIEPDRPVITVSEDIDTLVEEWGEHGFLAMFDGEHQITNVVHVATTNYPQRLDKRFIDRPSRFDTIMKIGMPSADARRMYLKTRDPDIDVNQLDSWVKKSEGFSISHLKELIIAVRCFNQPEHDVFSRLRTMMEVKPNSDEFNTNIGFGNG